MLRNWWSRFSGWLERFTPTQKRNLLIALAAAVLCLVVIVWVVMRPRYVTIMTGLDNKSLGEVQTQLQTLKIPSIIQGSSVEVPSADANTARVQLAMAGLPKSGYIGYSSVQNSFGMTQDQFNLQVLDALQQSLDATIESINGIESAQVHIVMPQQTLFVSQPQSTGKASVFVQLGTGVQLSAAQVAGIQQLVAHSVKGLSSNDVSVVDQNGVTLSTIGNTGSAALPGTVPSAELAARQQLDAQMTEELTSGLEQIVGSGNAVVMVHANVTFNQVQTQSHIVQPAQGQQQGLPTNTTTDQTTSNSTSGGGAGGIAGQSSTNPGLSTYAGAGGNQGGSSSSETKSSTQYANSYTNQTTTADPVQLNGYTVGVFLNSADKQLTPAVISQIRSFVTAAVGNQTGSSANNNISVSTVLFQQQQNAQSSGAHLSKGLLWGGLIGGAALLLGGGALVIRSRRRRKGEADDSRFSAVVDEPLPDLQPQTSDEERVREQLANLAKQKPDDFANLLRSWLSRD